MSVQKYRLQPVFDMKEKKKKDAEKALAETRKELLKQQKLLSDREQEWRNAIEKRQTYTAEFLAKMEKGMEQVRISQGKAYIEVLKQNIELAKKKVEEQKKVVHQWEKKVEAAVAKVMETTKDWKVIEKHKENWLETAKRESEMKEDKEQEEVAQSLYEQVRRRQS